MTEKRVFTDADRVESRNRRAAAARAARARRPRETEAQLRARLLARTSATQGGCIEYTGTRTSKGYGEIQSNGKRFHVHRLAWTLEHGPIPPGLLVCHRCDNPPCIAPEHLFVGTNRDNIIDCVKKGRNYVPDHLGSANSRAKLTEADVVAIRASDESTAALAARYGVGRRTLSQARSGRCWRHVPFAAAIRARSGGATETASGTSRGATAPDPSEPARRSTDPAPPTG